ncbi:Protein transport protein sec22 [Schizosaccharomyces pombe]|uniref:Protein transport protein sec22 n=1 Tax=Schizosaccharomyces pombe (strain 972 / ATCC 24843) TaxID=284812 RepID=SEC22_SCHPO|nr:putative SNARE protein Sec22 [Schizosaccharomyces pombe]Q9Y7L0.2 RecName: Full=Protein transport protein sec22 [Schizosaccharomyces pombe 972h-]CAB39850.2 SNARE Sec22 (predicted) [Schizosaccharomyces pombe]|eukprot:NP_596218.2 putative SNARE protein Sec22 [Schizosaccharomyces pombe]
MVKSTTVTRLDGLPLAASVDDESTERNLESHKKQAKLILKRLSPTSEKRASIESGDYTFHYLIDNGICYLCICEQSYPRKLAFSYLEELAGEFWNSFGEEALQPGLRPYAFVQFDTFMQKSKRVYNTPRANDNLDKLNTELKDVTRVMTKNIEDLLYRGDSLEKMADLSSDLRYSSAKYKKAARRVNLEALWRQYGPVSIIALLFLIFVYWRFFA